MMQMKFVTVIILSQPMSGFRKRRIVGKEHVPIKIHKYCERIEVMFPFSVFYVHIETSFIVRVRDDENILPGCFFFLGVSFPYPSYAVCSRRDSRDSCILAFLEVSHRLPFLFRY